MLLKKPDPKDKPCEGDVKITRHFALFPTKTDDGILWLEQYTKLWKFQIRPRQVGVGYSFITMNLPGWDVISTRRVDR
jgi:hypothetical protein